MDASQYKDYILVLLFMRYVSDKYGGRKDALIEVPEGGSFQDIVSLKGKAEIGDGINKIIGKLAEANNLKGIIDVADFNDDEKLGKGKDMQDRLSNLVAIFQNKDLDFSKNKVEGDDILGDAYEYLMRHFATESGKSKGQFYTPAEVSRVIAKVIGISHAERKDQTLYDPTCGSGSLLLKAAYETPHGITIYGQEIDVATRALAVMNMWLHENPDAEIWRENTISNPYFKNEDGGLKKCAIVTSYTPDVDAIKGETVSDEEDTNNLQKYEIYQKMLDGKDPEKFEEETKEKFIKQPGQMKLLIVVDKLLTGFDAPPATYLYIDKSMQDHGLFQAICRVNRLDGEDKDYGYIVDYKDLFKSLSKAVKDYTSGAFEGYEKKDVEGLLKDRVQTAREKLTTSLENIRTLCEPVQPPKETVDYIDFFCGDSENPEEIQNTKERRIALYRLTSTLTRAYANLANEMAEAGYTPQEAEQIKEEVQYYENVRAEIKLASGDQIDLKAYEPAMRHLIDTYIDAEESKKISAFDDLTIIDLIAKDGVAAVDSLPAHMRKDEKAVAETIENNVRRLIIEENPTNPKYYARMSVLLDAIIRERKNRAIEYAKYLEEIAALIQKVKDPSRTTTYPKSINSDSKRALYDNLNNSEEVALRVNEAILKNKPDGWRGNMIKERTVRLAIKRALEECGIHDENQVERVLALARNQDDY